MTSSFRFLRSLALAGALALAPLQPTALAPSSWTAEALAQQTDVQTVRSTRGMVSSETIESSRVGAAVLEAGGNAVDAAIATGLAMAVTFPAAGNIGGGGFMVIRRPDGTVTALDFREKAPLAAFAEMFVDENDEYSYDIHHNSHRAVGVPGTVAGFWKAHKLYGTVDWADLVDPAVDLAADGFPVTERMSRSLLRVVQGKGEWPASVAAFSNGGTPWQPGETMVQPDLARTMERIRDQGRDGFYKGETARLLADDMRANNGMITEEDLARYEARERSPVRGTYKGYDIISMAPPSSGRVAIVEMLNILEGFDLQSLGHNSAAYIHHLAEAMRIAFRDRAAHLADPDFVDVPRHRLTSKEYADQVRREISSDAAGVSQPTDATLPYEGPETTHYSVVDADGMAVSVTYTLEQGYGSGITVPGAGFLLNNEMGDFNGRPGLTTAQGLIGTEPNLARPEQRMLSSMTPTIIAKDGELVAVIGSPGGRTIINTVLQVALNVMEWDMGIRDAVDAGRIHHQWLPDRIRLEARIDEDVVAALEAMGHTVSVGTTQGLAHSIGIDPETGERIGAADKRNVDSAAAGH